MNNFRNTTSAGRGLEFFRTQVTKVRVHLRSGIAEIFEQHQDLMGKVDNNIVEIETNFENKLEKIWFVLQDAVFIVSNQKGDSAASAFKNEGTGVYIYAKRVKEINSSVSMEELSKQYDEKVSLFEAEKQKLVDENIDVSDETSNSKLMVIKDEIDFIKKVMAVVKDFKG